MSLVKVIAILIIAWLGYSILIMSTLTSKKAQKEMETWDKEDKRLAFRNARIVAFLLALATGLLLL